MRNISRILGLNKNYLNEFEDIYWKIFDREARQEVIDLEQPFRVKIKSNRNNFYKFEHIGLTGGDNLNYLLKNKLKKGFRIPSYEDLWLEPRKPAEYLVGQELKVISGHYLNGVNVKTERSVKSFTLIRDPRKLIISSFQKGENKESQINSSKFWTSIEKKLVNYKKEIGHINIQLHELAVKNSRKKEPYIHGGLTNPINLNNLSGFKPYELTELVKERMENDLVFVGITEKFSESALLLFQIIGLDSIVLWRPGLHSFRKYDFEEAPPSIQSLIEELCREEIDFYNECKESLAKLVNESKNIDLITDYNIQNKRPDLKFLQSIQERVEFAIANNDKNNLRLKQEILYFEKLLRKFENIVKNANG